MFEDIHQSINRHMNIFSEGVRDEFGKSIVQEVFEPISSEAISLMRMAEEAERHILGINHILEEARSITGNL
jgi:hypothetical protein